MPDSTFAVDRPDFRFAISHHLVRREAELSKEVIDAFVGVPHQEQPVVSLMELSLSEAQAGRLQQHFRSAVLMLDGDANGQAATETITAVVAGHGR